MNKISNLSKLPLNDREIILGDLQEYWKMINKERNVSSEDLDEFCKGLSIVLKSFEGLTVQQRSVEVDREIEEFEGFCRSVGISFNELGTGVEDHFIDGALGSDQSRETEKEAKIENFIGEGEALRRENLLGSTVASKVDMAEKGYRTRSKGPVEEFDWVMSNPI